jgi:hypothetical protein
VTDREPCQDIHVATVSTVGKALEWPQYTMSMEENDREASGGRIQVSGATRAQAIVWLRTAALALEQGRRLRVMAFETEPEE